MSMEEYDYETEARLPRLTKRFSGEEEFSIGVDGKSCRLQNKDVLLRLNMAKDSFITVAGIWADNIFLDTSSLIDEWEENWITTLANEGITSVSLLGRGLFTDEGPRHLLFLEYAEGEAELMRLQIPRVGVLQGKFYIHRLAYMDPSVDKTLFQIHLISEGMVNLERKGK